MPVGIIWTVGGLRGDRRMPTNTGQAFDAWWSSRWYPIGVMLLVFASRPLALIRQRHRSGGNEPPTIEEASAWEGLPGSNLPLTRTAIPQAHREAKLSGTALLQIVGGDKLIIPFC
jgi:hypothetical protein